MMLWAPPLPSLSTAELSRRNHKANLSASVIEVLWTLNLLTCTNSMRRDEERREMSVMKCEKSVMVMTLHWHSSQVSSLGNCIDDTPTETALLRPGGISQFLD